ncbi:hypothetical protein CBE89_07345 [Corynebacterium striatum]|uniref:1-deoxy-D-xylulose-5-phosphate synthase n=1 Tax=Corynebacterium striatum TaxID=43770 RepID=A0A2Z2IYU0_CORST|nr:DUF6676 family protein [Corynebacterium striatum]ART21323.1 hypothetical protein CBE89_07345 [Corynebacterium striatum]
MIPKEVDLANLSGQLRQDGVAFSNPRIANDLEIQEEIIKSLHPDHGIAVVDSFSASAADARDIAQDLQLATGLDTVIVQTPTHVSAVSDSLTRANIEAAERAIPRGLDQTSVLEQFYSGTDHFAVHWMAIIALILALAGVVGWFAYRAASATRTAIN